MPRICETCGGACNHRSKRCRSCYRSMRVLHHCRTCNKVLGYEKRTKQCRACYEQRSRLRPTRGERRRYKCIDCGVACYRVRCRTCYQVFTRGVHHPNWKGGRTRSKSGYVTILIEGQRVPEHRHVMEQQLGRALLQNETVHHKHGNKEDNRPENLELWVGNHPPGQRVNDQIAWAIGVLEQYAPEMLNHTSVHDRGAIAGLLEEVTDATVSEH